MRLKTKKCLCVDWNLNTQKMISGSNPRRIVVNSVDQNFFRIIDWPGFEKSLPKAFEYCPWCGKKLIESEEEVQECNYTGE